MKLLKKKLLFSLLNDQPGRDYQYHDYRFLYCRCSEFDRSSVRAAVNELTAAGLVDKLVRNRRSWFRLTALGRDVFLRGLPRFDFTGAGWDHRWRLVIVNRIGPVLKLLQRHLYRLGFKRFSRGVYVSPGAVAETVKTILLNHQWLNQVALVETRAFLSGDECQLARNLWHLEKIGEKYDHFITLSSRLLKQSRSNLLLLQQAKFGFKAVFDAYFNLTLIDPGLPKALLPPDWPAEQARSLFFRLVELAKTAQL
jgi:phenylacetic acid degradation operon negative regulatory protein